MSSLSPYALAIFLAACLAPPAHAQLPQPVELELVLAVDASGSVDRQEFELQIVGLAEAFRDPEIVSAIENFADRGIVVTEIQWAAPSNQIVAVEWTLLRSGGDAIAFADRIEEVGRIMHGETAIRQAMSYSRMLIETNGYLGLRQVVDISGDGPTNYGTPPDSTRDELVERGITINGLVIANEFPNLEDYYRDHVIGGFGSFVIAASDYEDFARAIKIKLLREILGAPITQAPQAEPGAAQLARVGH